MSLVKCKECGNAISKNTDKCPQCGAPKKKKTSILTWLVLVFIGIPVILAIFGKTSNTDSSSSTSVSPQPSAIAKLDTSPEMQAERKEFIEKLKKMGVIYKVEVPGILPHIYVAPGFRVLNIDGKQKFINVVFTYYLAQNPKANIASIYDSKSGKKIGTFTERGLDLD